MTRGKRSDSGLSARMSLARALPIEEVPNDLEQTVASREVVRPRGRRPKIEFHGIRFPGEQPELLAAVERSRDMLQLEDNWDTEGSPGYREETWRRAVQLLSDYASEAARLLQTHLPVPRIRIGPDGSIDIHWQSTNRELLLNVPADEQEPPVYYGDNRAGGEHVEGELAPPVVKKWLLMWLTE
jgi:hypothetical protein